MFVQIHDIIVKQVETKDISVNVNPNLCTSNMYFQQSVVWSERTKLFDKIFLQNLQSCQVINLCRNGTSKISVVFQTSAKNIHVAQICQKEVFMVHF
jgi:hypothetical protein